MLNLGMKSCYLFDKEIHKSPFMQVIEFARNALEFHTLDRKPFTVRLTINYVFINMMEEKNVGWLGKPLISSKSKMLVIDL
jgi:hypothetical protein